MWLPVFEVRRFGIVSGAPLGLSFGVANDSSRLIDARK